jgi:hypothetical protein
MESCTNGPTTVILKGFVYETTHVPIINIVCDDLRQRFLANFDRVNRSDILLLMKKTWFWRSGYMLHMLQGICMHESANVCTGMCECILVRSTCCDNALEFVQVCKCKYICVYVCEYIYARAYFVRAIFVRTICARYFFLIRLTVAITHTRIHRYVQTTADMRTHRHAR